MGFLGSFFSGLTSAVSGFFSSLGNMLGNIGLGGIAGLVSSLAAFAIPGLGLPEFISLISLAAQVVGMIAKALGLNEEDEKPEKLGFKAEVADLRPEDFDNMAEYNRALSEYELKPEDEERFESLSEDEVNLYKAVGMGIQIKGIESELSVTGLAKCLSDLSRPYAKTGEMAPDLEEIQKIIQEYAECVQSSVDAGISDMTDITNYLKDEPTTESKEVIYEALTDALGSKYPELSADDIATKICDMAEVIRKLEE